MNIKRKPSNLKKQGRPARGKSLKKKILDKSPKSQNFQKTSKYSKNPNKFPSLSKSNIPNIQKKIQEIPRNPKIMQYLSKKSQRNPKIEPSKKSKKFDESPKKKQKSERTVASNEKSQRYPSKVQLEDCLKVQKIVAIQ